jgi:hypothetical protein
MFCLDLERLGMMRLQLKPNTLNGRKLGEIDD